MAPIPNDWCPYQKRDVWQADMEGGWPCEDGGSAGCFDKPGNGRVRQKLQAAR